jgi:radical SAM superfamily enzyme YgiQ (UPF0313 family)
VKILLTAINAKYIHTNLAIYSLRANAKEYRNNIKLAEFTINHYPDDILQAIYKEKPDFIGFSCYIWNIAIVEELCVELRKLLPDTKIWLGGPEVSYDAKERLESTDCIDGIMVGEGEETFKELLDYYIADKTSPDKIRGIVYRSSGKVIMTEPRPAVNFSRLPFPYEDIDELENKIIYYETIRGCPYSCSYCLSSIDKSVRLRDMELVKKELEIFINHRVPQVKFVDRTFNCNRTHALNIWTYIKEHDNGITNFHFEISADILDEEELALLNTMRPGLVQLEIGVQSTNSETINAIHRHMDLVKLAYAVNRIHQGNNIHEHLDLIAGLPKEDYTTFRNSFNAVYALKPNQLQLGFLKVLKGSGMHEASKDYGIIYKSVPPYEVLYTKWLSYDEVLRLKIVEDMVEVYYNSGQFVYGIKYMEHFFATPFDLYLALGDYYEKNQLQGTNHARIRRYAILIDFMEDFTKLDSSVTFDKEAFCSILVHDLFLRENLKSRPSFAEDQEPYKKLYRDFYFDEQKVKEYLNVDSVTDKAVQLKQYLHLEHFGIDVVRTAETGSVVKADQFILYDYLHRNPLNSEARTILHFLTPRQ